MFDLHVYYKQGSDFSDFLSDDVSKSLTDWAADLEAKASKLKQLAELFKGKNIECVVADTNLISFDGDLDVLKEAVQKNLLTEDENED